MRTIATPRAFLRPRIASWRSSLACACFLALLTTAPSAHAQPAPPPATGASREQAKKLFEEGAELEKKGDFAAALSKFRDAEQITATAGLRFHEGYCLEMTGKVAAALEAYESADKMAREQNKQDVRAAITVRLEPLARRVPQIAIRLATPAKDAEVHLDGVAVSAARLDGTAFRLDPGEHVVTARAGGYQSFTRKLRVPESMTTTVDITLERLDRAVPGTAAAPIAGPRETTPDRPTTEPPSETPHRSRTLPIATTVGAVVLAGTGLAMFFVAGGKQSTAKSECPTKISCSTERSSVRTFDALALGGFIGAVGLGALSVVLWTSKPAASASASAPHANLIATPAGLGAEGSFW